MAQQDLLIIKIIKIKIIVIIIMCLTLESDLSLLSWRVPSIDQRTAGAPPQLV